MQQVTITCVVPITRYWALNQLFQTLIDLEVPADVDLSYYFYVDSIDPRIRNGLEVWVEELNRQTKGVSSWHYSKRPEPTEVRIAARRERVIQVHQDLRKLVGDVDYVFGIEDDTIVPKDALKKLLRYMQSNPDAGFIQGVQCGRWGYKMIGAWRVNDLQNPTKVLSMPYLPVNREHSFVEAIDGGGFYCYLTPAKLFKEADYRVEAEAMGVDLLYGLDLRRAGKKNFVDWSIVCGHNDFGMLIEPGTGKADEQVLYELDEGKQWHLKTRELVEGGEWVQRT